MFKHSLNLKGGKSKIEEFKKGLNTLVYTESPGALVNNGEYRETCGGYEREFTFNIDIQWEYEAALAIAAIREGEDFHVGEWVCRKGKNDCRKIMSITDYYSSTGWLALEGVYMSDNSIIYNRHNPKYVTKATTEQLINHFKNKYNMSKEIIGYKAPYDLYDGGVKKGTIYSAIETANTGGYFVPIEIVRTWEPVYKEEGFKKGEWVVILDASVHMGNCFNIGGVYQLKEDFGPDNGSFVVEIDDEGNLGNGYSGGRSFFSGGTRNISVRKATSEEIVEASRITIRGYTVEAGKKAVAFGCQSFNVVELQTIARLFNENIDASIVIYGVPITKRLVNRLIIMAENGV